MQNKIIFKIVSTALNFLMSIVIGVLVPRAIGPAAYGDYSYIVSTYAFLFQLLMFNSSTAYVYFISKEKYPIGHLNTFYMLYLGLISLVVTVLAFLSLSAATGVEYLWNGIDSPYLLSLGLVFAMFANLQNKLIAYSDSTGQTINAEKIRFFSRLVMVLSTCLCILLYELDIILFFVFSIFNFLTFFKLFYSYVKFETLKPQIKVYRDILADFCIYLKPLIFFTCIAAVYSYLGKYVLQSSGGSVEQGHYNFASQLALIPVTFISSIMVIYMSEMTRKFKEEDVAGVRAIFLGNIFKVYAIHASISLFMFINAKDLILFTVGGEFVGAVGALEALSIYSLLQTFGMLSGNLFFSSGRNKQYSIINSVFMIIGISYLTYVYFNGQLDSVHLAAIMASIYGARVLTQLLFNLSYLSIPMFKFFAELFLVGVVIFGVFKLVSLFEVNLFLNIVCAYFALIGLNFIANDYLKLKSIYIGILRR